MECADKVGTRMRTVDRLLAMVITVQQRRITMHSLQRNEEGVPKPIPTKNLSASMKVAARAIQEQSISTAIN